MLNNTIELYNKTLYNHSNTISNNAPNNVAVSFIPIAVGSIIGLAAKSIAMYITNSVTARIACYKKTYFALNIIQNTNTGNEIEINSIKNIKSELLTSSTKSIYSLSSGSMIAGIYSLEKALFPTSSDTNKQSELAIHLMLSSLSFLAINFCVMYGAKDFTPIRSIATAGTSSFLNGSLKYILEGPGFSENYKTLGSAEYGTTLCAIPLLFGIMLETISNKAFKSSLHHSHKQGLYYTLISTSTNFASIALDNLIQASNSEHGWLISAGISGAVQIALSILPVHSNIKTFYTLHSIISFASSTLILSSITNLLADQSSAPIITQNYTRILEPKSANYSNDATTIYDEHNTVNINTEVLTIEYE